MSSPVEQSDHQAIAQKYVDSKKELRPRLGRWISDLVSDGLNFCLNNPWFVGMSAVAGVVLPSVGYMAVHEPSFDERLSTNGGVCEGDLDVAESICENESGDVCSAVAKYRSCLIKEGRIGVQDDMPMISCTGGGKFDISFSDDFFDVATVVGACDWRKYEGDVSLPTARMLEELMEYRKEVADKKAKRVTD